MLGLAVGHWMEEALHALASNNTRKLSPMLVNVSPPDSREHPDALFLVTFRSYVEYRELLRT